MENEKRQQISSTDLASKLQEMFDEESLNEAHINVEKLKNLMSCYKCAIMEVETKFRVLNEHLSLKSEHNPIDTITSRMKSPESIYGKLKRRDLPLTLTSLDEIRDIAGVKVICSFVDDIYMLADCFLSQDDIFLIEKKDYIKNPKENGYRSLHLIVEVPVFLEDEKKLMKVEVQLRTIAMEFWANLEHKMRYKKNLSDEVLNEIETELLNSANDISDLDIRMQKIRNTIENS